MKIRDIIDGNIEFKDRFLLEEENNKFILKNDLLERGFFIMSTVGTIGKIGYYKNNKNEKIILSSNVCGLSLIKNNFILEKYLLLFFKTDFMINQLNRYKRGIAQQFLKIQDEQV